MDGLKNYREKIKNIEKLVDKMESGELSINELVELEELTRDVHERSIILKYKAFENRTGDSRVMSGEDEIDAEEIEEIVEEIEEAEEMEEIMEETPVMDFSMFDTSETTEEKEEEPEPEITPTVEVEKPEPIEEMPKTPTQHQVNLTQSDTIEPAADKVEPEVTSEKVEEEPVAEEPKVVVKEKEADAEHQDKGTGSDPEHKEPIVVVNEKGTSFLDRLSIADNSISSQLAGRKIDTLSGAFGINERLLYINELFDGSGEAFSDAVKTLDAQPGLDEASTKVEELAFKNSWNPEEEVVLEFLAIIKRRYA